MSETPPESSTPKTSEASADKKNEGATDKHASSTAAADPRTNQPTFFRRNKWRIAGGATLGIVALLVVMLALLPSLISAGFLRGTLLKTADGAVQGQITWDKLQLRWGNGQRIEGLKIADDQGNLIADVSEVDAPGVSLWSVMWGSRDLGEVSVLLKQADIIQLADGQYNLQKALTSNSTSAEDEIEADSKTKDANSKNNGPFGGLKVKLSFTGNDILIKPLDAEPVTIQKITLAGDLHDPAAEISFKLDSTFMQKQQPAGEMNGSVVLKQLMNQQGEFQLDKTQVEANLNVSKLIWPVLAAMSGLDQSYAAIVGDELAVAVNLKGDLLAPVGQVQLTSDTMRGDLKFVSTANALTIEPDASFVLNLNSKGWQVWGKDSGTQLMSPVKLLAQIRKLSLPRTAAGFDLAGLSASVDLSVSDVSLQGADALGNLSLTATHGELRTDKLGQKVSLVFEASAARNQQAGQISFNAVASDLADANGVLGLSRVTADVQASATDMPMAVVDQVMGLGNMLSSVLGPTLEAKLTANIRPSADGQAASGPFGLTLTTSQFKSRIAGKLTPDAMSLDETSNAVLELTPQGAVAAGLPDGMLLSNASVRFDIQQAMVPRTEQGLLLQQGKLNAVLRVPLVAIKPAGDIKTLNVQGVEVAITSQAIGKQVDVKAVAKTNADAQQGSFEANATLANLLGDLAPATAAAGGKPSKAVQAPKPTTMRFNIAAKDLSVTAIEALAGQEGVLVKWLGPVMAINGSGELADFKEGSMTLAMDSAQLKVQTKAAINNGVLLVDPQSSVQMTLGNTALDAQGVTLSQPMVVSVKLGEISLPVMPLALDQARIDKLSIHTTPVQLVGDLVKTGYGLSAFEGSLVSPRLADGFTFNLQGKAQRNGSADSPIVVQAQVDRPLDKNMRATGSVSVSKVAVAVIDVIGKQDGLLLAILGPELESVKLVARAVPDDTSSGAAASAPASTADSLADSASASAAASAPWQIEFSARSTNLDVPGLNGQMIPGKAVTLSTSSPIKIRITKAGYARLMRPAPEPEAQASSTAVTSELKSGRGSSVSRLLGSLLDAATRKSPSTPGQANASGAAQGEDLYKLDGPLDITAKIKQVTLSLAPFTAAATGGSQAVGSAPVPTASQTAAAEPFDLKRLSLDASVELSELAYVHQTNGDRVAVSKVAASLLANESVGKSLTMVVTGDTLTSPGKQNNAQAADATKAKEIPDEDGKPMVDPTKPVKGQIDTKIVLRNLAMLPDGGVDFYHMDSRWDVDVRKLPSPLLDSLAGQSGKLTGLLGASSDLSLTADIPGEVNLKLRAPLTTMDAMLVVTPSRVVHLRQDVAVQMATTPESVAMLGLLSPQLLALKSTTRPIQLVIYQKDFSLPLPAPTQELAVKNIRGDMTLELGQVVLRKQGMVKTIYEVLGRFGGKFNTGEEMNVLFTPMDVEIKNGLVKTNDMWLVSDELLMGTQAQIDMTKTPAFAHVFVAISGQTLMKMPGAKKNIGSDYVVEIKVASPLAEVKLNYEDLVLQLTPLFVTTYTGKKGGEVLDILGGAIDVLKTLDKKNDQTLVRVNWLNHPQPEVKPVVNPEVKPEVQPEGKKDPSEVSGSEETPEAKPEAKPEAVPFEETVVDSIIDLFNKKKKK